MEVFGSEGGVYLLGLENGVLRLLGWVILCSHKQMLPYLATLWHVDQPSLGFPGTHS